MRNDPRIFQLMAQVFILSYASLILHYPFFWLGGVAVFLTGLFFSHLVGKRELANLSFINTTLSTLILIRCENLWIWIGIGLLTMFAKLAAKERGKHIFNPSNFAFVLTLILFPSQVWVDPGLWAQSSVMIGFCLAMGFLVNKKAHVLYASLTFILFTILFEVSRSIGLGDPLSIPLHNLKNGALFIFTFFTLTDPKTAPRSVVGQILFAIMISSISFALRYSLFIRGSWFYALFIVNLLTPLLHFLFNLSTSRDSLWKKSSLSY